MTWRAISARPIARHVTEYIFLSDTASYDLASNQYLPGPAASHTAFPTLVSSMKRRNMTQ